MLQGQDEASEGEWSIKLTAWHWRVVGALPSTHFPSVPYREPKGYEHACQGLHAAKLPASSPFLYKAAGSEVISARFKSEWLCHDWRAISGAHPPPSLQIIHHITPLPRSIITPVCLQHLVCFKLQYNTRLYCERTCPGREIGSERRISNVRMISGSGS